MRVYTFGNGEAEGSRDMLSALGGKGAGLARMSRLGVPVPPGFTISTDACRAFFANGEVFPEAVSKEIDRGLAHIEASVNLRFGDAQAPLLVSVRSGAAVSMPGMMDTILNVGLTRASFDGLVNRGGDRRFALDSYRRLCEMYADVALDLGGASLSGVCDEVLSLAGVREVKALTEPWLDGLGSAYEKAMAEAGQSLPQDPNEQLRAAIEAVFRSWNNPRAVRYRRVKGISDSLGTAVTVEAMVFGNLGNGSATGVAYTRDPNTGLPGLCGEYLPEAQGEDVVSGAFTPLSISGPDGLLETHPDAYGELERVGKILENTSRKVQELEFTIERGKLWMLQTRRAQVSTSAAVRTCVDMVNEGLISREEAIGRLEPLQLYRLLHASVAPQAPNRVIAKGLPASPGAVSGRVIFEPEEAVARSAVGERVVLVRVETSTDDLEAMRSAAGVLTSRGGMTSHAALVARGLGTPCVTGCSGIIVEESKAQFRVRGGDVVVQKGDWISINGGTGEVMLGEVATSPAAPPPNYDILMQWADGARRLSILGNAEDAEGVRKAFDAGAEGVGLCSTEHMFFDDEHLALVRELVLAHDARTRRRAIEHILPVQRADFRELFSAIGDQSVSIRLLDLPLHELMPAETKELEEIAERLATSVEQLEARARLLRASNPVLGHRGSRLGLTFPELYEVQVRAVVEAVIDISGAPDLKFVLPLVTCPEEVRRLRTRILHCVKRVCDERGTDELSVEVGAMVESPRACLVADEIAAESDFLLFGTTDLTIATYAMFRDDAGRFLPFYLENDIFPADPFVELDEKGVRELLQIGLKRARSVKPDIRCGLAGDQAAHPASIKWCHDQGIDFITAAPHRLPIARLAAAQAAVPQKENR